MSDSAAVYEAIKAKSRAYAERYRRDPSRPCPRCGVPKANTTIQYCRSCSSKVQAAYRAKKRARRRKVCDGCGHTKFGWEIVRAKCWECWGIERAALVGLTGLGC